MSRLIHGEEVFGVEVDAETRCRHWNSPLDIVAIRFKCCGQWYSCWNCHAETSGHEALVWQLTEFGVKAILCGGCGVSLSISEYLECGSKCPECRAAFNPGCAKHAHLYFEM